MKKFLIMFAIVLSMANINGLCAITSIDTKHTITKVATAQREGENSIIAVSYAGTVMEVGYNGKIKWEKNLTDGIMCYDIWCEDITGDNNDEILLAIADGSIYCLDKDGETMWHFKENPLPMISLCVVHNSDKSCYIAAGGNDRNLYYISTTGELLDKIPSNSYNSKLTGSELWLGEIPEGMRTINQLRPIPQKDGSDILLVNYILGHAERKSELAQFKPMAKSPFRSKVLKQKGAIAEIRIREIDNQQMAIISTTGVKAMLTTTIYNPTNNEVQELSIIDVPHSIDAMGYRVVQTDILSENNAKARYITKVGDKMIVSPSSLNEKRCTMYTSKYSYNDMCRDFKNNTVILASSQSGGSCIHIIDLNDKNWGKEFSKIEPKGKIEKILKNTATLNKELRHFEAPNFERKPQNVYLMDPSIHPKWLVKEIKANYPNLKFMGSYWNSDHENWDREMLKGSPFYAQRDNRMKYTLTQDEVVKNMSTRYTKDGLAVWGGHGTDPFFYNPETIKKVINAGGGKKSVWIWPELTILHKDHFETAFNELFYPLAKYAEKNNAMLFLRNKHAFWYSEIYTPLWEKFLDGDFAKVFIPSMEETEDKSMDLSLAGRLGLWTSGVADQWGTRCARDNPSFTRNRQFSNQNLPNHFLRNAVFHTSYGARYIDNFPIESAYRDYISALWEMIAKGTIFVPKREEIISFSPVHLSMITPDKTFDKESNAGTATMRVDATKLEENPFVFDRLNGAWTGAKVSDWDFSAYASNVKDRRLNFLAPFPNGMVLITPPQAGAAAKKNAKRGKLTDNLHPLYKSITTEFYTDGRNYYSADMKECYDADEYYTVVKKAIEQGAKKLPLNVTGDNVAWVAAESAPRHIRLTLIDGGYINPDDRVATVTFNTVKPIKITDVLTGKKIKTKKGSNSITVEIPCGLFRFIDIEVAEDIK